MSEYTNKRDLILNSLIFYFTILGLFLIIALLVTQKPIFQLLFVLIGAQIGTISLMFYDKLMAVKGRGRVPENALFLVALFLGSPGLIFSMNLFRHKRQKDSFLGKVFLILIIQLVIGLLFIIRV